MTLTSRYVCKFLKGNYLVEVLKVFDALTFFEIKWQSQLVQYSFVR